MSEFSIEEKAKRYDEAIKLVNSKWHYKNQPCFIDVSDVFPELKESEDERTRKELTDFIKKKFENSCSPTPSKNILVNWIAWLEKQDSYQNNVNYNIAENEKKEFIGDGFIKCCANFQDFKEGETYWLEYLGDDNYNVRSDNLLNKTYHITPCQLYTIFKKQTWFEKQSQSYLAPKSASQAIKEIVVDNANKVEPKFHEGDFIKHNKSDIVYKVFSICNNSYFLKNIETDEIAGEFERFNLEQNFHLWTIQDAKNGDVLWHSDSASNGIFIFKKIRSDGKVLCYCDYDSEDHFCLGEHHTCCWITDKYIKPATKEQRELLFRKMKEAAFKWNSEKKELKY